MASLSDIISQVEEKLESVKGFRNKVCITSNVYSYTLTMETGKKYKFLLVELDKSVLENIALANSAPYLVSVFLDDGMRTSLVDLNSVPESGIIKELFGLNTEYEGIAIFILLRYIADDIKSNKILEGK